MKKKEQNVGNDICSFFFFYVFDVEMLSAFSL
jgi:hypothetical protein